MMMASECFAPLEHGKNVVLSIFIYIFLGLLLSGMYFFYIDTVVKDQSFSKLILLEMSVRAWGIISERFLTFHWAHHGGYL